VHNINQSGDAAGTDASPFHSGVMVLVTLSNSRDKFWGVVNSLRAEGLSITGVELSSFDGLVSMIKAGDPPAVTAVFFPMHRIDKIEMDLADGAVESLSDRFAARTGLDAAELLMRQTRGGQARG
jgi:hypothetical protein